MRSNISEISNLLKEFENHWNVICDKTQRTNHSNRMTFLANKIAEKKNNNEFSEIELTSYEQEILTKALILANTRR